MHATGHAEAFLLLTVTSLAYQRVFARWERLRRGVADNRVPDLLSTWTCAAFLLLPGWWLALAIGVYYLGDWKARSAGRGSRLVQLGKFAYSIASVELGALAASRIAHSGGFLAVPAAIGAFILINFGLVVVAVAVSGRTHVLPQMFRSRSHLLEVVGQVSGIGLAALLNWHWLLIFVAVPSLCVVHLVASHDAIVATNAFSRERQTWSADALQFRAGEMLSDSGYCSIIVVDTHGSSEPQLSNILAASVGRGHPIGTLGNYYVVLVESETQYALDMLADRIERFMAAAGVCVSLGTAAGRRGEADLDSLISDGLDELEQQQNSAAAG